jgi:hypothetical protein
VICPPNLRPCWQRYVAQQPQGASTTPTGDQEKLPSRNWRGTIIVDLFKDAEVVKNGKGGLEKLLAAKNAKICTRFT